MPTRIEVIQSLRARDVIRNDDLNSILDYIDQGAGSSNAAARNALLRDWRDREEVAVNDLERIYDYTALLGTPVVSFVEFVQGVRDRDFVSLRLVNYMLDMVDAAGLVFGAGLKLRYKFSDLSTMWQDAGRTTPVTGNGDNIEAIDGIGSDPITLFSTAAVPTLDTVTNGVTSGAFAGSCLATALANSILRPKSWAAVFSNSGVASTGYAMAYQSLGGAAINSDGSAHLALPGGVSTNTYSANEMVSVLATQNAAQGRTDYYNLDAGSAVGVGQGSDVSPPTFIRLGAPVESAAASDLVGNLMEVFAWDHELSAAEVAIFKAYTTSEWGVVWA